MTGATEKAESHLQAFSGCLQSKTKIKYRTTQIAVINLLQLQWKEARNSSNQ